MNQLDATLAAVVSIAVEDLTSAELAAANCALTRFGTIPKINLAHEKLVELDLVRGDEGLPVEPVSLGRALAKVIHDRMDVGTFQ